MYSVQVVKGILEPTKIETFNHISSLKNHLREIHDLELFEFEGTAKALKFETGSIKKLVLIRDETIVVRNGD